MLTLNGLKYDSYKYVQLFSMPTDIDIDKIVDISLIHLKAEYESFDIFVSISSYARW